MWSEMLFENIEKWCFLLLILLVKFRECANILYLMPFTSKSHYIMLKPIGIELARRGHNVTVVTGYVDENPPPNYHQIFVGKAEIWDFVADNGRPNVFEVIDWWDESFHYSIMWKGLLSFMEMVFNTDEMQDFLKRDQSFDLVLCEQFYEESLYALAHKYGAPLVLVTTFGTCTRHNILTRNPLQLATLISEFLYVDKPMSFWGRFRNMFFTLEEYIFWRYWYLSKHEDLVSKYIPGLPEPVPRLHEIQRNASLILLNSHFSYDPPVALLPNMIEVGGLHLSDSREKVPKDIQVLLDKSENGVIYISLGSNVRSSELPIGKIEAFLNIFKKLSNYTILWKWEDDVFENKPLNVHVRKWFPQRGIFQHPKVRLFISHGGRIGIQEAVYNGVPIIGIPIYADQYNNLLLTQEAGYGRVLKYENVEEKHLGDIIDQMLNDASYKIKAKEASSRFRDRPMSALNTSVFWIEYVIRNNGAEFIKNPALQLSWIAYNMLDVYAFILLVCFILFYFPLKCCCLRKKNNVGEHSKKNN